MKSFLASLAARAYGLSEVVQPRPQALFEPPAPEGESAVAEISNVAASAPTWTAPREISSLDRPLNRRIIEIEHLLAAAMPPVPTPGHDDPAPALVRPAVESAPPVSTPMPTPELSAVVAADPISPPFVPVVPLAIQSVMRAPGAAPDREGLSKSAAAPEPKPAPATPPAPPSVTIRIERIDVRAMPPATPIARTIAAVRRANVRPSLGDYLSARR